MFFVFVFVFVVDYFVIDSVQKLWIHPHMLGYVLHNNGVKLT